MVMVPIVILVFAVSDIVSIPVCLMAVAVTIAVASYLPAAVPAVIAVVIVPYNSRVAAEAVAITVSITETVIIVVAEARIISEACLIRASPLPIFLLARTAQPVVFDIVVPAFDKPLPIVRIILPVVAAISPICVWVISIAMLGASSGDDCSHSQS